MPSDQLADWLAECSRLAGHWYVKRLSCNDTQATGSHQAGPYVPKNIAFRVFPELNEPECKNPRVDVRCTARSHEHTANANIIWYNNKLGGGTRDETRVTRFGGEASPLLDTENTGAIVIFFFTGKRSNRECLYWVCRGWFEEDVAESYFGPVEPKLPIFRSNLTKDVPEESITLLGDDCWVAYEDIPADWLQQFPSPKEVFEFALHRKPYINLSIDDRVMKRRTCEYAVFRSVEHAVEMPEIEEGFNSIDTFVSKAQTILQRRKARSGRSLELQMAALFREENIPFAPQANTESNNRPDFIIPSQSAYDDINYPEQRLRMLAVKTTVKERWRQILNEAERISDKHLFTLQEGASENQFTQMRDARVTLVVPKPLHKSYPKSIRRELMTLQDFVEDVSKISP